MIKRLLFRRLGLLILFFLPFLNFGEGIKELMPDTTVSRAWLYFTYYPSGGEYANFAVQNCPANYRLYIHVKNPGESILIGLNTPYSYSYNLRKPDGTIVLTGSIPNSVGQLGYIRYYHQAMKGPFPSIGGYSPLKYTVTSIADTGNYYFEIANPPTYLDMTINLWDFQVVSGEHTPALPTDTINGRVWSQSWQFDADLGSYFQLNASLYVLSDDNIVTKLRFSHARVGVVTIFCNPTGCYNTGNPVYDRKSYAINTFTTFPGIAQYKVFINNPDTSVYRSGVFGSLLGPPLMIPDPAFPPCSGHKLIVVDVDKAGNAEIDLSFPYGAPATNVTLFSPVIAGTNTIEWNGNDGMGNPVPDGTSVNVKVLYTNGLTNLPIWDQEQNPDGFQITLVRPHNPVSQIPLTFWDDSNITELLCPQSTNLTGCLPYPTGCHVWGGYDCHDKMINTWWYGSSDTAVNVALFARIPLSAIGHDSSRCGPGSVMIRATVPSTETVDWYDTITSGTPLLIGNTVFVTPVISGTTTYYAEARQDSSVCTSSSRTPVQAIIKPITVPRLYGPRVVCDSSTGNPYVTDALMSNYIWTVTPGNLITGGLGTNRITVSWLVPGLQHVSVNYDNPNGCAGPASWLYTDVIPYPDSAGPISGPGKICAGTNGILYSVGPVDNASTYVWTVPPGVVVVSGNGTNAITVNFPENAQSGNFIVYPADSCGNGFPSIFPVRVYQHPLAFAGRSDTICQDNSFTITHATASHYRNLLWTTNGPGILTGDSTLTPTYTPATGEYGTITLTLIAFGILPCGNDTSRMNLLIIPKPVTTFAHDAAICEGRSFSITGVTASNYQSVTWSTSGSGYFNDPANLQPVYYPGVGDITAGYVYLFLKVNPLYPCLALTDSIKLTINQAPVVSAGPGEITCELIPVTLNGAQASNYDSLDWKDNGQGTLTGIHTLTPTYFPLAGETGMVLLTLTAYGKLACSDSAVIAQTWIHIYPAVVAEAGPDRIIPSGTQDTLSGTISGGSGFLRFKWQPLSLLLDSISLNPVTITLLSDTSFILTVTDSLTGCSTTDTVHIRIKKPNSNEFDCIKVYNVITPNGDGLNDEWIIDCIVNYPDNKVEIFNEWGDLVARYTNYDNVSRVWKGTDLRGMHVPDGTYYYVLTIKDMKPKAGWILVRGGW